MIKLTDVEYGAILGLRREYNLYTDDKDRCDGHGGKCDCDRKKLDQLIEKFRKKHPNSRISYYDLEDMILD